MSGLMTESLHALYSLQGKPRNAPETIRRLGNDFQTLDLPSIELEKTVIQ